MSAPLQSSRRIRLALALLALLTIGSAVGADDWPQWLGPKRDGVWRETGILDKFPEGGPKVLWRAPVAAGYSGPAVADGRVYVHDHTVADKTKVPKSEFARGNIPGSERVLCLNAADGKELWKHEYDCPYTVSYPLGPRTTPVINGGKVYSLGAEGNLFCLDAAKGKPIWSCDFKKVYSAKTPQWGHSAHPLIDGDKLICMVGGEGAAVVAFDKNTGKETWKALNCTNVGYCPPTIYEFGGRRQLIVWHGEEVAGLDPETGKAYWSEPFKTYQAMSIATPRQEGDSLFLTATFKFSKLMKVGSDSAKIAWSGDGKIGFDSVFATPFVENGYAYGVANNDKSALACIKLDTGERLWTTTKPNLDKKINSADIFIVKNGDKFFLWTEQGDLLIANLSPKECEIVDRTHLLDATSTAFGREVLWSHPAFANKCMFAKNDKELICVSLAK